ncbi:uncharacterized protein N7503_004289 [Penicillium pulvis]|uniref:uncharacterized protein n=1 Tax=Penicillium pulvis TaxID=1562058 RepID=UPI00254742B0|nr:uncharacterized protein N7503_004289 [Penicillium pulvis]KAJ5801839.1 hypothetical protein N7503_004289 [Penicillium pulvis]
MKSEMITPFVLSPLDHVFPPVLYVMTALYFQTEAPSKAIVDLQRGISHLREIIPFLDGEVAPANSSDKPNAMEVRMAPRNDIASLVPVKYYPKYCLPAKPGTMERGIERQGVCTSDEPARRLVPEFDQLAIPAPIFRAQINILADGLVLCLVTNHMVIDGKGNDVLYNLLAQCCRSPSDASLCSSMATQAATRRYLHNLGRNGPIPGIPSHSTSSLSLSVPPSEENEQKFDRGEGLACDASHSSYNLLFSNAKIQLLKSRCNARLPEIISSLAKEKHEKGGEYEEEGVGEKPRFVSSNDILTALLWICITRVQQQQSSTLGVAVNSRKRFPEALPDDYLGNAVAYADCTLMISELQCLEKWEKQQREQSLCQQNLQSCPIIEEESIIELLSRVAYRIRCSISRINDVSLGCLTAGYYHTPDWSRILLQRCDILVSSLRDWSTFELDFGPQLQKVLGVEFLPASSAPGECLVRPARKDTNGEAAWEVMVTLQPAEMEQMLQFKLLQWPLEYDSEVNFYRSLQVNKD